MSANARLRPFSHLWPPAVVATASLSRTASGKPEASRPDLIVVALSATRQNI